VLNSVSLYALTLKWVWFMVFNSTFNNIWKNSNVWRYCIHICFKIILYFKNYKLRTPRSYNILLLHLKVVASSNPAQARCAWYNIMWQRLSVTCDKYLQTLLFFLSVSLGWFLCNRPKHCCFFPFCLLELIFCVLFPMTKRKRPKGQTMIYKSLQRKLIVQLYFILFTKTRHR
jgi:hypothetical protein